jgi:hypothetical protein
MTCVNPQAVTTHAITIDAPPERVWPWLVQMGWGRHASAFFFTLESIA